MTKAKLFKTTSAGLLGLGTIYWLAQGILAARAYGNLPALPFLLALILVLLLLAGLWKPLAGGILQAFGGVVAAMYFLLVYFSIYEAMPFLIFFCAPLALAGLLSIEAAWRGRKP
jgi:hypothetical protein